MSYNKKNERLFGDFMQGVIAQLKQLNRERTSETYTAALRSFMIFRENQDLPLSGITSDLLLLYEAYLKNRGICMNTISFYMRILRAVYNRAVERGLIAQQHQRNYPSQNTSSLPRTGPSQHQCCSICKIYCFCIQ